MSQQTDLRDQFLHSLSHARRVLDKLRTNSSGRRAIFDFADAHKLSEGLFLSVWTDWEAFVRELLIADLADDPRGRLRKDIGTFRYSKSPWRLAEILLSHPDHPQRYVEWDYDMVKSRAEEYLDRGNRFSSQLPRASDLALMKRMRNAIAHGSQKARESFRSLVRDQPFNLTPGQLRWLSVGRFLYSHSWDNNPVLEECLLVHEVHTRYLVP